MASYPTDLSDSQLQVIEPYWKDKRNRKYTCSARLNAIFYLVKTGCRCFPGMLPAHEQRALKTAPEKG